MNTTKSIALSYSSFARTQVVMIKELTLTSNVCYNCLLSDSNSPRYLQSREIFGPITCSTKCVIFQEQFC